MKVRNFPPKAHEGCPVYLRQFGYGHFEYLAIIDNELYGAHLEVIRPWYKRLLRIELSEGQVKAALNQIYAMAEATIETRHSLKKEVHA